MPVTGLFENAHAEDVGTSWVTLYTAPTGLDSILIELDACNLLGTGIQFDAKVVFGGGGEAHIAFGTPIPPGATLQIVHGQKIVLKGDDYIQVRANVASAVDVIASLIEDVNTI